MGKDLKRKINDFIEIIEEIQDSKVFNQIISQKGLSVNFNFEKDRGVKISTNTPEKEQFTYLLANFRKVYMDNESTNFHALHNLIMKSDLQDGELKANLKKTMQYYKELLNGKAENTVIEDERIFRNNKDLIKKYLNGEYFHNDEEKKNAISKIKHPLIFPIVDLRFKSLIVDLVTYLIIYKNNLKDLDI